VCVGACVCGRARMCVGACGCACVCRRNVIIFSIHTYIHPKTPQFSHILYSCVYIILCVNSSYVPNLQ